MKVQEKLDEIKALVGAARTLPMSSSIIVNKAELLRLLTELSDLLPDDLAVAQAVLSRRDAMLYEATANAERLLTAAIEERNRMVSEEEVLRDARIEAAEVIRVAEERTARTYREVDEYVDAKLAHLEVAVTNILDTLRQGRQRLADPGLYGELAAMPVPEPSRPVEGWTPDLWPALDSRRDDHTEVAEDTEALGLRSVGERTDDTDDRLAGEGLGWPGNGEVRPEQVSLADVLTGESPEMRSGSDRSAETTAGEVADGDAADGDAADGDAADGDEPTDEAKDAHARSEEARAE